MAEVKKIRLASRQSPLALRQTEAVAAALRRRFNIDVTIVGVSTRGDEITDRPLAEAGGKALFIKGLQDAIANGQADAAVHSLKDMEAQPTVGSTDGFVLAAVGFAQDCRDALICNKASSLDDLPAGAVVGTCSPRRAALLKHYHPTLQTKPIRGNLQTRLAKLDRGDFNALLLAAAGVLRLNLPRRISAYLSPARFIPAVGQGLLGLECAANNSAMINILAALNDEDAYQRAIAERTFSAAMQGDCHTALGAYARIHPQGGAITLEAFYAADDGGFYQTRQQAANARAAGQAAAADIMRQAAAKN